MQKLHHLIAAVIIPWAVLTRFPSSIHQEHDLGHTEIIITNPKPAKKRVGITTGLWKRAASAPREHEL